MNRNSNSHFSIAPQVSIERSTFNRDSTVKTSFNVGEVIPFYLEEVLPGDTFKVKTSKIARMQTLKTPMMDDVFLDTYYFFVPNRLVWSHWREFMGENTESAWIPTTEYTIPQIEAPSGGWNVGTIADYLGVRPGVSASVNALPFRAYALICNEWFRDENLMDPLVINVGDSTVTGVNTGTYTTDVAKGGLPFIACKTHDYFTSALPAPQKGPDTQVSITQNGTLDVFTVGGANDYYAPGLHATDPLPGVTAIPLTDYENRLKNSYPVVFDDVSVHWASGTPSGYGYPQPAVLAHSSSAANNSTYYVTRYGDLGMDYKIATNTNGGIVTPGATTPTLSDIQSLKTSPLVDPAVSNYRPVVPINLVAGKYGADNQFASRTNALAVSVNDLRQAFQIQRFYEKAARGGCGRYIEIIKSMFGVTSPDARMMRPEYLGGNRLPLNVRQITQTSSTTENQPLGDVAGMSVTTDNHFDFEKSFTEHGYIIGCCVARYHHTYQQGIERLFNRQTKFDFYWPVFAHLGEQGIKNKELYAQGTSADNEIFGYQEAWAEYRYKPNKVSGMMRSDANTGLDTWHLGDDYSAQPYLSASWIREDKANLDRVLQVTSSTANQIFADIYVENKTTRPMPLYSIPGLIDHF